MTTALLMGCPLRSDHVSSLTSHTLNSTAPDVLHHRHAEKGSGAYAILDLCRFQDSVVTNQKSVRLNHGAHRLLIGHDRILKSAQV